MKNKKNNGEKKKKQLNWRNKAKKELERLENISKDVLEEIDEFKDKFLICEKVYKVLLAQYLKDKNKGVNEQDMKIHMNQVKSALRKAGYDFDDQILSKLFSSNDTAGERSVKKIRDRLTHSMQENDIKEFKYRKEELYEYMNYFLDKIRNFDKVE